MIEAHAHSISRQPQGVYKLLIGGFNLHNWRYKACTLVNRNKIRVIDGGYKQIQSKLTSSGEWTSTPFGNVVTEVEPT